MNNAMIGELLPLQGQDWVCPERLRLKRDAAGDKPLYFTHNKRIINTSKRLRISMPYNPTKPEQEDCIFTAGGLKLPYPGGFDLPKNYERHDAALSAATFVGAEDPKTAAWMSRTARNAEEVKRRKEAGTLFAFGLEGRRELFSLSPDTLLALAEVVAAAERHGEDGTVRLYTMPHRGHTLVTLAVGEVTIQFLPLPVPEDILKGGAVWRIDNPQLSIA